jgi:ribosome-binding factor A
VGFLLFLNVGVSMDSKQPSRIDLLASCDATGPGDGVDPRFEARGGSHKVTNRKALQLCGQVAQTLTHVFRWECGDECLQGLTVESVEPAPNSSRLRVTVAVPQSADVQAVKQALQRAAGMLRAEVAAAIHRKRTPELICRVVNRS